MREGIPAVVAMQYEITDPAALAFAAGFYESLARGNPVDQAVTKAREIVRVTQNSLEWATPVLFLASDETRLFEVVKPPKSAPPASAVPHQSSPQQRAPHRRSPAARRSGAAVTPGAAGRIAAACGTRRARVTWQRGLAARVNDWLKGPSSRDQPRPPRLHRRPEEVRRARAARTRAEPTSEASPRAPRPGPDADPKSAPTPSRLDPGLPRLERLSVIATAGAVPAGRARTRKPTGDGLLDGTVRAWNVRTGRWAAHCNLADGVQARSLAWSPWPRHVASAHDDGTVVVWDLEREVPLRFLRPDVHRHRVHRASATTGSGWPSSGWTAPSRSSTPRAQTRRRFRSRTAPAQVAWSQAPKRVGPSAFAPGDRHLVVAANDGAVVEIDSARPGAHHVAHCAGGVRSGAEREPAGHLLGRRTAQVLAVGRPPRAPAAGRRASSTWSSRPTATSWRPRRRPPARQLVPRRRQTSAQPCWTGDRSASASGTGSS